MNFGNIDMIYWDPSYNSVLLINLFVVIGLFSALRLFSGTISHINASDELIKRDNPAFGISLAGVTFAVTILLTGTIYGTHEGDLIDSASITAIYGIISIVLLAVTRFIFDKIALPNISLRDEISDKNIAVAIVDTSNVIAAAIIIRAILIWITDESFEGLIYLIAAYAISQAILTFVTFLRLKLFAWRKKRKSIEKELKHNNVALALSFAGKKIGAAFAISVASHLVVYEVYDIKSIFLPWIIVSFIVLFVLKIISFIAEQIILFQVDTDQEILEQKNVAVGAMEGMIYMSLAILLAEL